MPASTAMFFARCEVKLGYVANVLHPLAFDETRLIASTAMYNALMLGETGSSRE